VNLTFSSNAHGIPRTDEECHVWDRFIAKPGWRDERAYVLPQRIHDFCRSTLRSRSEQE
jgi:hypothetical protein